MAESIKVITETEFNELQSKLDLIIEKLENVGNNGSQFKMGDWLSEEEAQSILGKSTGTLWRLRKNGKITFTTINSKVYYSYESILKLMEKNTKKAYR